MNEKEVLLKTINEKKAELVSARKGTDTQAVHLGDTGPGRVMWRVN